MNKGAIKDFAVEARRNLLEQVAKKAEYYSITGKHIEPVTSESDDGIVIGDRVHIKKIKKQREDLVRRVEEKGYKQVMEEAAYTWFNRFIAIRFMEVNDYLPTGVRVLSSITPDKTEPDIITSALSIDLPLDKEIIYGFQDNNNTEALYKYLLVAQCNELYKILPFLFEEIEDYTELLLPDNLLFSDSVIRKLVAEIPEEDFREVEIIGWLYQFYISEKKDEVFSDLKKNIKISKENIPAATQLFTPAWIVKYMVENSAGRLWLEAHPDKELQDKWKYYIEPAEQEPEVQKQLDEIIDKNLKPEDIKILDPCMGSGHILVYAFEVMYEIYRSVGYVEREIPKLILTKNLYGLDIDDRAAQLACFTLMMKARSYNRRVFREEINLNLCSIQEFCCRGKVTSLLHCYPVLMGLCEQFIDGKEFGSLIEVRNFDRDKAEKELERFKREYDVFSFHLIEMVEWIVKHVGIMVGKYDVVVTNPPYMGNKKGMSGNLKDFVNKKYKDSKSDLMTCFMERCGNFATKNAYIAMINIPSWMFLSSFERLRYKIIANKSITSLIHFGRGVFGSDFGTVAFVIKNVKVDNYSGTYRRLFEKQGAVDSLEQKEKWFLDKKFHYYAINQESFTAIPGNPIAYWLSYKVRKVFENAEILGNMARLRQGMATSDNDRFLKLWPEVEFNNIGFDFLTREEARNSGLKWFPYNKGGEFRKWYGNNDYLVNWKNDGEEIKSFREYKNTTLTSNMGVAALPAIFKPAITWSALTISKLSVRYYPKGFLFDTKGPACFPNNMENLLYFLALLNSLIIDRVLRILSPTVDFNPGALSKSPVFFPDNRETKIRVDILTEENITISPQRVGFLRNFLGLPASPLHSAQDRWQNIISLQFLEILYRNSIQSIEIQRRRT